MAEYTKFQQKAIKNFYDNREDIALQRVQELVTELYLTEGKKRAKHWDSVALHLSKLGVKPDVIYSWAQWGHIPSRRSQAGRLWIDYTPAVEQTCLRRIARSYKLPDALKTQVVQRLERTAL